MRRKRLYLSITILVLTLGAAVSVWAFKTGKLTIFGDAATLQTKSISVVSPADLLKGVIAGSGTQVTSRGIELVEGGTSGTAVFTVGERDIQTLYRIVPTLPLPITTGSTITISVAGSIDGVAFDPYSPEQPLSQDSSGSANGLPVDLGFLVSPDSRFARVRIALSRTDPATPVVFAGFTLSYGIPTAVVTTTDATNQVLVNGTAAESAVGTPPPKPGRPDSLVVTGIDPIIVVVILLGATATAVVIVRTRHNRTSRKGTDGRTSNSPQ